MKKICIPAMLLFLMTFTTGIAQAQQEQKTNTGRHMKDKLGLGYNSQFGHGASLKYYFEDNMGFQGILGYTTDNYDNGQDGAAQVQYSRATLTFGAKFLYNLFVDPYMMCYTGGGLGYQSYSTDEDGADGRTQLYLIGVFGVEYFIPWFPNLGLGLEVGLGYTSYTQGDINGSNIYFPYNNTGSKSILDTGLLGFHYYFDTNKK